MMKKIAWNGKDCTGCRNCLLICSYSHEGAFNPKLARLRVLKEEPKTDRPVTCIQCGLCMEACPRKAIFKDKKKGYIAIDEKKCSACGECVKVCPNKVIFIHPERKKAVKCDLCLKCISMCPPKVLELK